MHWVVDKSSREPDWSWKDKTLRWLFCHDETHGSLIVLDVDLLFSANSKEFWNHFSHFQPGEWRGVRSVIPTTVSRFSLDVRSHGTHEKTSQARLSKRTVDKPFGLCVKNRVNVKSPVHLQPSLHKELILE
ncbi:hypothetical protein T265_03599 [Opisthorchis viverrini]|uniref:Uncharacterized protein n=1 Tax=Opisthorchis viverrini TaxID=6198 RepID=A0A074ZR74_OPIVI|nr:hypothetical protein T265_03599 [Opisthorchis viverrini]KER29913.1 hypothetical protein T265_03599 [Opisthorchis viverrini]